MKWMSYFSAMAAAVLTARAYQLGREHERDEWSIALVTAAKCELSRDDIGRIDTWEPYDGTLSDICRMIATERTVQRENRWILAQSAGRG